MRQIKIILFEIHWASHWGIHSCTHWFIYSRAINEHLINDKNWCQMKSKKPKPKTNKKSDTVPAHKLLMVPVHYFFSYCLWWEIRYNKLYQFKLFNSVAFGNYINLWDHHQNQYTEHFYHALKISYAPLQWSQSPLHPQASTDLLFIAVSLFAFYRNGIKL